MQGEGHNTAVLTLPALEAVGRPPPGFRSCATLSPVSAVPSLVQPSPHLQAPPHALHTKNVTY